MSKKQISKKKPSKAFKKRLAVFGTISIIIIVYFIFSLGSYSLKVHKLKKEQQQNIEIIEKKQLEEKELRNEIEKLQDSDYIARYARENYSYSKNGEYILKLKDQDEEKEKSTFNINIDYNYIIYGGIIIIIIIIIHTIRKKK